VFDPFTRGTLPKSSFGCELFVSALEIVLRPMGAIQAHAGPHMLSVPHTHPGPACGARAARVV